MKGKSKLIALGLLAFGLVSCGSVSNKSASSESAEHTHVFKANTYACEDRTCIECGKVVSATEKHSNVLNAKIEPTCVNQGYSVYTCANCSTITKDDYVHALGHDYEAVETIAPTCANVGYTAYKCSRCEANYKTYEAAISHVYDDSKTKTVEPTCTNYGKITKHCSVCGDDIVTEILAPLGHTPDSSKDKTVDPTCESEGYTSHCCTTCQQEYKDAFVEKKGHDYETFKNVDATCEHGSYKIMLCKTCGDTAYFGGEDKRLAHSFGEDGVCTTCSKDYHEANYLCFIKGEEVLPYIEESSYGHLVYSDASKEEITGEVNKADVAYLLSKKVSAIGFTVGSNDTTSRKFEFAFGSSKKSLTTKKSEGYTFSSYFKMAIAGEEGKASENLSKDGSLSFSLTHDVASDAEAIPSSFPIFSNVIASYDAADPYSWVEGKDGQSNVTYYPGLGWKIDYLGLSDNNSYVCYISKDLLAEQKEKGMTKVNLTFTNTYSAIPSKINEERLDSFFVNYDFYAYQWDETQQKYARKGFGAGWLHTNQSMSLSNLSNMDFTEMGLEMNFGTNVWNQAGNMAGHIYLTSITFEA